jgi:bacterioferritin
MNIADQLETHAQQELQHALIISRQIDYLGKMPTVNPKPVKVSEDLKEMFRFDPDNENETIRNYRKRIRQCEAIGEFALAEQIRKILESGLSVRTDNILAEMGYFSRNG